MAKLTMAIIETLYAYGKSVYNQEIGINEATEKVLAMYPGDIAESSASFYIGLYSDYISGKGSSWNQNGSLVLYYVEHITDELGISVGKNAFQAGMKFAKAKTKNALIKDLTALWARISDDNIEEENAKEKSGTEKTSHMMNEKKREEGEQAMSISTKEAIARIKDYIESKGFSYKDDLIENFYLSLKSKPFVILAGTSGTGKTRLVKLFAEAIGAAYKLVSVRPDWSDGSDLFGHYDLNGRFIDGPVCECFTLAHENPHKPVFLCLDEMNLARVEYYLSDFLSVIESREKDAGGKVITAPIAQYEKGIPDNLYVIGTVNMDETTFPFSKKVLDRANTIEFSYVDLMPDFDVSKSASEKLQLPSSFLGTKYLVLNRDCAEEQEYVREICAELQTINEILAKANAHVGYRVRDEIVFYMLNNKEDGELLTHNEAFDNEIMQKILPRIQGSATSIRDMLCELFTICAADPSGKTGDADSEKMRKVLSDATGICRYRNSAKKIELMVRRFEEDGFTSYWL